MSNEIISLRELVERNAAKFGPEPAFQMKRGETYRRYSYNEVLQAVAGTAQKLIDSGVKHGDRVAVLSENRPEWPISYLAIASMGAVVVPLDVMLLPQEIENLIKDSGAKGILLSENKTEKLPHFTGFKILMKEVEKLKAEKLPEAKVELKDLAAILYTSGTTGVPKGVMLTHGNIMSNVCAVSKLFTIGPGDNFLSVLPLHHTFEATAGFMAPHYRGACLTYAESLKSYNLLKNMVETKVTIMCGVPLLYNLFYDGIIRGVEEKGPVAQALFRALLGLSKVLRSEAIRRKLFSMIHKKLGGHIRFWVSGGAAIDPEVIRNFELFGITILQGYGLTESAPILACNDLKHNCLGSVGRPLSDVEIKLTEDGEIIARGPNIMEGYYKRRDLTAEVIKDGWLYTGDQGTLDKDGYVYITGRIKDIIVSGSGVNVYPDELEFFLKKIPGIKESCVVGVKVKEGVRKGMEEAWAIVVPDYDHFEKKKVKEQSEVESYIRSEIQKLNLKLAEYKRIAQIRIRSIELPKTTTRKVKRFQVKKEMGLI